MPANNLPFEFNSEGKGSNTRIDYLFRDGDIVVRDSIILEGPMTAEDAADLAEGLEGAEFLPNKLGLPDLLSKMPLTWEERGDGYHVIERISATDRDEHDFAPTADQFLAMAESSNLPMSWSTEYAPQN